MTRIPGAATGRPRRRTDRARAAAALTALLLLATFVLQSCGGSQVSDRSAGRCGNGVAEPGEQCDGADVAGESCSSLAPNSIGGSLSCRPDCTFDLSTCAGAFCGNGAINGGDGGACEICDGDELAGLTCGDFGGAGSLRCLNDCSYFDLHGCENTCGNGSLDPGEECDASPIFMAPFLSRGESCVSLGYPGGTLGCNLRTCRFDVSSCLSTVCGNGILEPREDCDGDAFGFFTSCEAFGFVGGTLTCNSSCAIDTSACTPPTCGNGILEAGESCDGDAISFAATCGAVGLSGGTLKCTDTCQLDSSGCTPPSCGNGVLEVNEACDGDRFSSSETCSSMGFAGGTLKCTGCQLDTSGCTPGRCGDGILELPEECDGSVFSSGATCETAGFARGTLTCGSDCMFDTSACVPSTCGDGVVEGFEACDGDHFLYSGTFPTCGRRGFAGGTVACSADCSRVDHSGCTRCGDDGGQPCEPANCGDGRVEPGERCDGQDFSGLTCQSFGFASGTLACNSCQFIDASDCGPQTDVCGNGRIDPGEACDGQDFNGFTCERLGFAPGTLGCENSCQSIDTSRCGSTGTCGNGRIDPGEPCDGQDFGGLSCATLGFAPGALGCEGPCSFVDTSTCGPSLLCGNGRIDPFEDCDGQDFGGLSCEALGFAAGALACGSTCHSINTSGCGPSLTCGNGRIDSSEACDGEDFGGLTCNALGLGDGALTCASSCTFIDKSRCGPSLACGNGRIDPLETCDGLDLNGLTCETFGLSSGTLTCGVFCTVDTSRCGPAIDCGNGRIDPFEMCDGADLGGLTCQRLGFAAGTLACQPGCGGVDTSACGPSLTCGNGRIDPFETCDGANFGGFSCERFGFGPGNLACDQSCHVDTSGCGPPPRCGNGKIDPGEACDGADLGGNTCAILVGRPGTLLCDNHCQLDSSGCADPCPVATPGAAARRPSARGPQVPLLDTFAYSASKAAVHHMTPSR